MSSMEIVFYFLHSQFLSNICFCLQILWLLVSQHCVCSKCELMERNKSLKRENGGHTVGHDKEMKVELEKMLQQSHYKV
jgi:hypothetical protein